MLKVQLRWQSAVFSPVAPPHALSRRLEQWQWPNHHINMLESIRTEGTLSLQHEPDAVYVLVVFRFGFASPLINTDLCCWLSRCTSLSC